MNAQEWNKLRKNWASLLDVYQSTITDYLFMNGTITDNDKKRVKKVKTSSDKMEKLLSFLKSKPTELKAFDALISALERAGGAEKELAERIRATESDCDASLKSEVDPHFIDDDVRRVLHENFVNQPKCSTKLSEIREVLLKNGVFKQIEWKNDILTDFVWKEFVGVDIEKNKRIGKSREILLKNISKIKEAKKKVATVTEQQNDVRLQLNIPDQKCADLKQMLEKEEVSAHEKKMLKVSIKPEEPTNYLQEIEESSPKQQTEGIHPKCEETSSKEQIENLQTKLEEVSPKQQIENLKTQLEEVSPKQQIENVQTKLEEVSPKQQIENLKTQLEEVSPKQQIENLKTQLEEMSLKQQIENLQTKLEEMSSKQQIENVQTKLEEMSSKQLMDYLYPKMKQLEFSTDILEEFVKENVTGSVFLTMTENDFKENFPTATFGMRRFLFKQINDNQHPPSKKIYSEYPRRFNMAVQHTDKYIRGRCIVADVNARGGKMDPVRNFHLIQDQDEDEIVGFIASEVVPFASACLNDRRDGTIYFGISPPDGEHSKPGEIVGVSVSKEEVQSEIRAILQKSFEQNQQNIISGTVRDAKFIPVVFDVTRYPEVNLWVVEVDIVPSSFVLKDEKIRTKLKCLPKYVTNRKRKDAVMFRFSSEGIPEIIPSDELYNYEKDQPHIVQQRQEEEASKRSFNSSKDLDLKSRLLGLLTGGNEVLQDTIFPFLLTSPIDTHMDMDYLSRNMTFIRKLNPEVVFDFDPTGSEQGIYKMLDSVENEVMRVLITENFDKGQSSKEEYTVFTNGLANESRTSWVFSNGYEVLETDPMEPTEWNRKRRSAFQESLRLFKENFDEDRIIVIICLFSKKYEVMIEACEEVLTKLPDNWMLLTDSEDTAKLWQSQILARNKAEKQAVTERCVIGMPWELVNITIQQAFGKNDLQNECLLPTSSGALVDVREKKLKDWCDIDVLSAGDFFIPEDEKERKKKEVEERFYRGEQVSWLNFYFHDQVLKRDIHDKLMQKVVLALEGNSKEDEDKVMTVSILHQPGAGGTTTAKQILWDLRKTYRCCFINNITDQTCDQLDEIRTYNDSNPKPLLILLDNEDDEKIQQFIGNLDERGRKSSRFSENFFSVYCTVIICIHRASLPKQIKSYQISLQQELGPKELEWFKLKNDSLESRFKKDKEKYVNPKFLISFNILRENFNTAYISKVVKEFSDDVKSTLEVKLLKIISLLNTFDLDFKFVQVSCLDKIIEDRQIVRFRESHGTVRRNMKWEANLSQGVKVLLNLSSNKDNRSSLRVFNRNIAQEILTRMKERTGQKESEIMEELLESGIFELESYDAKKLQTLINNVFKKRELRSDGIRKHKFSKFVIYVETKESKEVAVGMLEHLFELNQDPFTAQVISRFYIDMKNWNKAEHFAKTATNMLPTSSYLWDTCGQVYKNQFVDKILPEGFKDEDIHDLIELSEKCIGAFRTVQKVSEKETTSSGESNLAGYFGELRAIVLILSALKMCPSFSAGDILHKYLIDENFQPDHLHFLNGQEISYVKHLEKRSAEAIRRLDEEYLQMKTSSHLAGVVNISSDNEKRNLLHLKVNLDEYFGEASDFVPKNLSEPEKWEYIRRRVKGLGAKSLHGLLILRQNSQTDIINTIYFLMTKKINNRTYMFDDYRTLLDTVTVLMIDNNIPDDLRFEKVLFWCRKLYEIEKPEGTHLCCLETFLYYVMYNFPTEERQIFSLCEISDLKLAIEKWQSAFMKKYPKVSKEGIKPKRETTLFFLGNGQPLHDIVNQDALSEMDLYNRTVKWDVPEVRKKLRMMYGSLSDKGEKVKITITTKEGNKHFFFIQTSHRVTKKDMWQKKVYFYVGFSFSGPRAYGMSTEELGIIKGPAPKIPTQTFLSSFRIKPQQNLIFWTLIQELNDTKALMKKDPKRKLELERKIQRIEGDIRRLLGD